MSGINRNQAAGVVAGLGLLMAAITHATADAMRTGPKAAAASVEQALAEAARLTGTDPAMVRAIAQIESAGNPLAMRWESHLGEASVGLMQTLVSTAQDMWDKGWRAYPRPSMHSLLTAEVSAYYGTAYLAWLQRYYPGSEEQIVRRYNGGPRGDRVSATLAYWERYQAAKETS